MSGNCRLWQDHDSDQKKKRKKKKKERQRGRYREIENTHTPQCFLLQMCSLAKVLDTVCLKDQSDHENKNTEHTVIN